MTALFLVSATIAAGWLPLAWLCLDRARSSARRTPTTRPAPPDAPRVVAVVPARNEAEHIGELLGCLRGQSYPRLSIVVVDDESEDETARIVLEHAERTAADGPSIRLIAGNRRPEGWAGKPWALHQGVESTSAEWVWMVDADLWLHPEALATAIEDAGTTGSDFVSYLGRPRCETFWQSSIALALLQILSLLYPLHRVNDPSRREALAHGAFILVRRTSYDQIGGIASVCGAIIEDIRLADRVKSSGVPLLVRAAPGLSQTHMYGSFGQIWRGLRKNAFAGMDYRLHKFVTGALLGLAMTWGPPLAIIVGFVGLLNDSASGPSPLAWIVFGAFGWTFQAIACLPVVVYLQVNPAFAFTLPAGLAAYVAITMASVWDYARGRILWKGRSVPTASLSRDER